MSFTTSAEDQRKVSELKARLEKGSNEARESEGTGSQLPSVSLAEGTHKYVLIAALQPNGTNRQHIVVSKKNAEYHQNAAEPMVDALEKSGYTSISVLGGGRINLNVQAKTINIYGYSYGFGLADHALSKSIVASDSRYEGFDISWSNEGY